MFVPTINGLNFYTVNPILECPISSQAKMSPFWHQVAGGGEGGYAVSRDGQAQACEPGG